VPNTGPLQTSDSTQKFSTPTNCGPPKLRSRVLQHPSTPLNAALQMNRAAPVSRDESVVFQVQADDTRLRVDGSRTEVEVDRSLGASFRSSIMTALSTSTINQPINQSINQSINQLINLSINQPTNQPTNQPIDQSIYQAINELKPITVLRDVWRMLAFPLISSIPMTKVFILPAKLSLSWQTDGQTDKHQTSPAAAHHHTHTTVLSTWSDFTNCCQIFTNSFTCHWCANLS